MELNYTIMLPLDSLRPNEGQVRDLPKNPRVAKEEDISRLEASILETPEMLELRELIVMMYQGQYVIVAGNMRYLAMQRLGIKEAPCKVIPESTPVEAIRKILLTDNVEFGEWNTKLLVDQWSDCDLQGWGLVKFGNEQEEGNETLLQLTFTPEQFNYVNKKLGEYDSDRATALKKMLEGYRDEA